MTYAVSRFSEYHKDTFKLQSVYLAEAGINQAMAMMRTSKQNTFQKSVPDIGSYSTIIYPWGLQTLIYSEGNAANQKTISWALLGTRSNSYYNAAVTVADERYPLTIAGNSRITGDVYTGELGMQQGRLLGQGIVDNSYHSGQVIASKNITLPKLSLNAYQEFIRSVNNNIEVQINGSYILDNRSIDILNKSTISVENNLEIKNLHWRSFDSLYTILVDGYTSIKNDCYINSYLQIIASNFITIEQNAILENVLLYSKDTIVFSDNTQFSGIAISEQAIIVKDSSTLRYPSELIVLAQNQDITSSPIHISSPVEHETSLYLLSTDSITNNNNNIYIATNVTINGVVYSDETADIRGNINGSILVEQFTLNLPPSTYVNWLYNIHVNRQSLDYAPILPCVRQDSLQNDIKIIRKENKS